MQKEIGGMQAKDYVEGMFLMLQASKPDTYVLATNRTETVRDLQTWHLHQSILILNGLEKIFRSWNR